MEKVKKSFFFHSVLFGKFKWKPKPSSLEILFFRLWFSVKFSLDLRYNDP